MDEEHSCPIYAVITFSCIVLFISSLLNMIFSINEHGNDGDAFGSDEMVDLNFITDLKFGDDFEDIFGYIDYYPIRVWRYNTMQKITKTFRINLTDAVVPKDTDCKDGYKKCGIINLEHNLCLKKEYNCPINKIIINTQKSINEHYTTNYMFGGYYIHFTNESFNDYILQDFNISENVTNTTIDRVSIKSLANYNPNIQYYIRTFSNNFYVSLNRINYVNSYSKKDYENKKQLYNQDKIDEMNDKVNKNKNALMFLGIFIFVLNIFMQMIFFVIFLAEI